MASAENNNNYDIEYFPKAVLEADWSVSDEDLAENLALQKLPTAIQVSPVHVGKLIRHNLSPNKVFRLPKIIDESLITKTILNGKKPVEQTGTFRIANLIGEALDSLAALFKGNSAEQLLAYMDLQSGQWLDDLAHGTGLERNNGGLKIIAGQSRQRVAEYYRTLNHESPLNEVVLTFTKAAAVRWLVDNLERKREPVVEQPVGFDLKTRSSEGDGFVENLQAFVVIDELGKSSSGGAYIGERKTTWPKMEQAALELLFSQLAYYVWQYSAPQETKNHQDLVTQLNHPTVVFDEDGMFSAPEGESLASIETYVSASTGEKILVPTANYQAGVQALLFAEIHRVNIRVMRDLGRKLAVATKNGDEKKQSLTEEFNRHCALMAITLAQMDNYFGVYFESVKRNCKAIPATFTLEQACERISDRAVHQWPFIVSKLNSEFSIDLTKNPQTAINLLGTGNRSSIEDEENTLVPSLPKEPQPTRWRSRYERRLYMGEPDQLVPQLLEQRGVSPADAAEFLNPGMKNLKPENIGVDPDQLEAACEMVERAINQGKPFVLIGDYDADGKSSVAIMTEVLQTLGAKDIVFHIPKRQDHYGLSGSIVDKPLFPKNATWIVMDSGVGRKAAAATRYAVESKQAEVIVIDHHIRDDLVPAGPTIHGNLCAAGLTYVFGRLLEKRRREQTKDDNFRMPAQLDLAGLATIADVMPLGPGNLGNRVLAKRGIEGINNPQRLISQLILREKLNPQVPDSEAIGFFVAPMINAFGRMGYPEEAVRLLLGNPQQLKPEEVKKMLDLAVELNEQRKTEVAYHKSQIMQQEGGQQIIIAGGESMSSGCCGIIAAKFEQKPAFIYYLDGDVAVGSARSNRPDFNVYQALLSVADLTIEAGGHDLAAGFTLPKSKLKEFKARLTKYFEQQALAEQPVINEYDFELDNLDHLEEILVEQQKLEPFGNGWLKPNYLIKGAVVTSLGHSRNGKHLVGQVQKGIKPLPMIGFEMKQRIFELTKGEAIDLVFSLGKNPFHRGQLQLTIQDFVPSRGKL